MPTQGFAIRSVQNPSVETGLHDVLDISLMNELATRGALGNGTDVDVSILRSSTEVVGVEGERRMLLATLTIEIRIGGARPRQTQLTRSVGFTVDQKELSEGRYRRQMAFQTLANQVSGDAAEWILYAP